MTRSTSAASSAAARRSRSPSIVFLVWAGLLKVSSSLERSRPVGAAPSSPLWSKAALTRAPPWSSIGPPSLYRSQGPVSYTHLRAHETDSYLVCRLLLEKKKKTHNR